MPEETLRSTHLVDFFVIGVYFVLMASLGFVFKRLNKDTSDYFRAGCRATWWVVGASLFMNCFSAFTFTGAAGAAYRGGWSVAASYYGAALALLVCFLFLAAWFRRLRCITFPEVLSLRFGEGTRQFYAWYFMISATLYSGVTLYSLSLFCASVYGFPMLLTIFVVGTMILIYSCLGGSWAVMSGDFLQSIVLIVFSILCFVLALVAVGGFDSFREMVLEQDLQRDFAFISPAGHFEDGSFSWAWCLAIAVMMFVSMLSLQGGVRFFGAKDDRDARKAALFAGILLVLGPALWFLPPMIARLLFSEQVMQVAVANPPDASYAVLAMNLLPRGLTSLMVVAMFTATVSSVDSGLNRNAAVVVQDVYPLFCRLRKRAPRNSGELIPLSIFVTFLFGVAIIAMAIYFSTREDKGIFQILIDFNALFTVPMTVPLLLCFFIRRAPHYSAIVSVIVGTITGFVVQFFQPSYQLLLFSNLTASTLGFVLCVPFWNQNDTEYRGRVDKFFALLKKPVVFDSEVGQANDPTQAKILGFFLFLIGLLLTGLLLLDNPLRGRLVILAVAATFMLIGAVINWFGRRGGASENA